MSMPTHEAVVYEAFAKKVARLYLSGELPEDGPVEPVEVLDALITEAREFTGERPDDLA
jgi:hypothetical protein